MIPELALFDELHNTIKNESYCYRTEGHILKRNCDQLRHWAQVLVGLFPKKAEKHIAERQLWVSELLGRIELNLCFFDEEQHESLRFMYATLFDLQGFYAGLEEER